MKDLNDEQQNFFDTRTILAVLLVGLTFVGWQTYMQKKYPTAMSAKKSVTEAVKPESQTADNATSTESAATTAAAPVKGATTAAGAETLIPYQSENLSFDISSQGMGLRHVLVNKFKDRKGETIELGHPDPRAAALETRPLGHTEPLQFKIEKVNDNMFVGRARLGDVEITKTLEIDPEKYLLNFKVAVTGEDKSFIGLSTFLTEEVMEKPSHNFLMPQFEKQEFYVETADTHERVVFHDKDAQNTWTRIKVASVGSQYFTQAILDHSEIMPEAKGLLDHEHKFAELSLQYTQLSKGQPFDIKYQAFIGPKSHQLLMSINEDLAKVVDFGFFNWIGRHILVLLKWFYSLVGNWGLAIILLTILVRFCVLPFNIYSYKSMRAMQAIQPQIQALREKYKDDQQKQQQEMMGLMRTNKVNPLGGCLPVFLQFPIFIALYQVLGNSIELYQAPFGLWIHDLSLKDPFYVLPVLMGVTMFFQQKITPNTMDPAQAKVMLMMPIVFTFFMVSLPSGLTLYMWVGALFSVIQQTYFMSQGAPKKLG